MLFEMAFGGTRLQLKSVQPQLGFDFDSFPARRNCAPIPFAIQNLN